MLEVVSHAVEHQRHNLETIKRDLQSNTQNYLHKIDRKCKLSFLFKKRLWHAELCIYTCDMVKKSEYWAPISQWCMHDLMHASQMQRESEDQDFLSHHVITF